MKGKEKAFNCVGLYARVGLRISTNSEIKSLTPTQHDDSNTRTRKGLQNENKDRQGTTERQKGTLKG